jgi:hypothetical protein
MTPKGAGTDSSTAQLLPRLIPQSQYILHVEHTARFACQKTGCAQSTFREGRAAGGLVGNFDAFARPCKYRGVIPHDIATAYRGKANGRRLVR